MQRPTPYAAAALLLATAALGLVPAAATGSGTSPSPATGAAEEETGRLVLVLDSSGSMAERAPGGGTKIEAARRALTQVVDELPDDAEVGLRVFGATVFSRGEPGACTDTQSVVPVGPLDRDALRDAVADYAPYGETPIGNALLGAAEDLGDSGERTIVLLSDGEPTCAPDPCAVARRLRADDVEVRINVVGLDVSGAARRALQCTARAGGGTYVDAASADDLATGLVKVSVRDLRGFRLVGERVRGGLTPADALPLEPGSYVDSARPEQVLHYLVDKPAGGGVALATLVRPPKDADNWQVVNRIGLQTLEGTECAYALDQAFQVIGLTPLSTTAVQVDQFSTGRGGGEECQAAEQLVATVELDNRADVRLQVSSTPAVVNAAALPGPVDDWEGPWTRAVAVPRRGPTTPVAGGVTPDEAPVLEPGTTYTDTLLPSEQLVYAVEADHGQAVRVTARLEPDPVAGATLGIQGEPVTFYPVGALGTAGPRLSDGDPLDGGGFYNGDEARVLTAALPPIRARNAESSSPDLETHTRAGRVHVVLGMGFLRADAPDSFAVPVRLRVEVVGEPSGVPEYAEGEEPVDVTATPLPTGTPSPSAGDDASDGDDAAEASATADDGGPGTLGLLLGVGALLLAALVVAVLLRLRRRTA